MKFLFIGGVYPNEKLNEYKHDCSGILSYAAEKHQRNIIIGLEKNLKEVIPMINASFLPAYPTCKKIFISKVKWSHCNGAADINVEFFNIRGLRQFSKMYSLKKELNKYLSLNKIDVVICYTLFYPYIRAINLMKKKYKFKVICIVPDLPTVVAKYKTKLSLYEKISRKYNLKKIEEYQKCIDKYVLLTEQMAKELNIIKENYCVIDGLYDENEYKNCEFKIKENQKVKRFVYTGSINEEYGLKTFLEAFKKIKRYDIELYIAGKGNLEKYILNIVNIDKRVKYLGVLEMEEVLKLQESATFLINPRTSNSLDAKYSFPSKTIEYMLSGTPILMEHLPGMDKEYKKLIIRYNGANVLSAIDSIEKALSLKKSELDSIAKQAFDYVYYKKNSTFQTQKIIELLGGKNG